jgi:hypothetical protein
LLIPKIRQVLQAIAIPPDAFGVMLKQSHSLLHLGFLDRGLKNAITLLTSVSFLPAAQVLLMAASTAGVVASAGRETTPRRTASSLPMLG